MKAYMAYSQIDGAQEGAILVIANSAKEAKKLAWKSGECLNVDEWIDLSVKWLKDDDVMKLSRNYPFEEIVSHITPNPPYCKSCGLWGCGITSEDLCCNCNENPGDEIISILKMPSESNNLKNT